MTNYKKIYLTSYKKSTNKVLNQIETVYLNSFAPKTMENIDNKCLWEDAYWSLGKALEEIIIKNRVIKIIK